MWFWDEAVLVCVILASAGYVQKIARLTADVFYY